MFKVVGVWSPCSPGITSIAVKCFALTAAHTFSALCFLLKWCILTHGLLSVWIISCHNIICSKLALTVLSRHNGGTYQENEVAFNSSGNTCSQSSQLAKPLWTNPYLKKWDLYICQLISTLKKKMQRGIDLLNLPPNPCTQGKSPTHPNHPYRPTLKHW